MGSIPPVERQFVHSLSDEQYLHLLFMPVSLRRTPAAICPHITFVSNVCQAQHSIALGLEPHAPLYGTAMGCDIFHRYILTGLTVVSRLLLACFMSTKNQKEDNRRCSQR